MMKKNLVFSFVTVLLFSVFMAGCRGKATEEAGSTGGSSGGEPTAVGAPAADPSGAAVPEDVPIMDGGYNLDVIREGSQVNYTVDGDIETVMAFYQAELPLFGWEDTRAPDSAIGSIGNMSRKNAAGDSLTISLSYNGNGNFVTIQIAIIREN